MFSDAEVLAKILNILVVPVMAADTEGWQEIIEVNRDMTLKPGNELFGIVAEVLAASKKLSDELAYAVEEIKILNESIEKAKLHLYLSQQLACGCSVNINPSTVYIDNLITDTRESHDIPNDVTLPINWAVENYLLKHIVNHCLYDILEELENDSS